MGYTSTDQHLDELVKRRKEQVLKSKAMCEEKISKVINSPCVTIIIPAYKISFQLNSCNLHQLDQQQIKMVGIGCLLFICTSLIAIS